jgi:branched-chain amino acid transport system substrate-binding protein
LRARALVIGLAAALVVAGCGKDDDAPPSPGSSQLTVYSSLPLQGPTRVQSLSVVNAEKLALSQAGGKAGPFIVKYVSLDDSRASSGRWDPGAVLSNARRAVEDRSAVAYLGEADSGASAIAIPVLNSAGLLTVSPASTYPGLTTTESADKGEPEKYYPSGARTFARVVPSDARQARVQVRVLQDAGCTTLFVVSDRDVYGRGIAAAVANDASESGIDVVGEIPLLNGQKEFGDVAERVAKSATQCIFTGVSLTIHTGALFAALHDTVPTAKLFAPDALDESAFTSALTASVRRQITLTSLALMPTRRVRSFTRAYRARYGTAPEPYAIYGYEAMRAVLRALHNSGNRGNQRSVVLREFFALRDRNSVLGRYSISPSGDTSLDSYSVVRFPGGKRTLERAPGG